MKHILIDSIGMLMHLDFEGDLTNLVNDNNGALFELRNPEVFINAYVESKPESMQLSELIEREMETLHKANFSASKINFLRQQLGDLSKVNVSDSKKIKTQFKDTNVILLRNGQTEQLQFYVDLGNKVLIMGLMAAKEKFTNQNLANSDIVKKVIASIKSLTAY